MPKIKVHSDKYPGLYTLVDADDFKRLNKYYWSVNQRRGNFYVVCNREHINGVPIKMHRVILGITDSSIVVDHIDGNTLNNCKINLRPTTHANNILGRKKKRSATVSKYIGVRSDRSGKWVATYNIAGKTQHIGYYANELKAAIMRDAVVRVAYGGFARLNFPDFNLKMT